MSVSKKRSEGREARSERRRAGNRGGVFLSALFFSLLFPHFPAFAQSSIGVNQGIVTPSGSGSGTVTTGAGLTGDGSSGSPVTLSAPVAVSNGGTGAASAGATAAHNIGAAAEGANSDITSLSGLTTPLSVAQGGSGAAASGAVAYSNIAGGMMANVNLTGTDTISLAGGNQKLTLTANETLTIQKGSIANEPSSTNLYSAQFEICQYPSASCTGPSAPVACCTGLGTGCGNDTLAFAAGTGVSNIYWSGGMQPGYTLTAGYGDWYACSYDGTNLRCRETMSNQPC